MTSERPRSITILGATGSIGRSTLDLVRRNPNRFAIEALTAASNVEALAEAARAFNAKLAVIADPARYNALKEALSGSEVEAAAGSRALIEAAQRPSDLVMAGIVGSAGLAPTLAAIRRGAVVALANKETLVCAGEMMMAEVRKHGATLLPVDSEHNAIFQVFESDRREAIDRIILTASGGPFRSLTREQMAAVTPAQAVAHPNWSMGAKISVDSATMMNKGLELIEAHHLFQFPENRIDILVHPQSVVHSMVSYADGSILAQLGTPDMRTPIAYAMAWPERMEAPVEKLDFAKVSQLTFEAPDAVRFPCLTLARECMALPSMAPVVLNAANEIAVAGFLEGAIGFLEIAEMVERALERSPLSDIASIDDVLTADAEARARIRSDILACQPAAAK